MMGRRGEMGPDTMGPGMDRGGDMGMMGRRGFDPNDPDITGPRGAVGVCQERLTRMAQWRLERIQRLVSPTDDQRPAFEELKMASAKAVETLRAACPGERPLTAPAQMAAAEKWLEARLQAIKTVRPALDAFYRTLSDEQKIRWSTGPQVEGRWGGSERERRPMWSRPGAEDHWRDQDGRRGFRREWDERERDPRDRFGFDRGRGGDGERWDHRWRDDERGGFGEYRWRDQDRNRWRDQRGREQRNRSTDSDEERL